MNQPRSSKEKIWFLFCNENKKRGKEEYKTKSVNKKQNTAKKNCVAEIKKKYCD